MKKRLSASNVSSVRFSVTTQHLATHHTATTSRAPHFFFPIKDRSASPGALGAPATATERQNAGAAPLQPGIAPSEKPHIYTTVVT